MPTPRIFPILLLWLVPRPLCSLQVQQPATETLQHALHLADLYNWPDAAKDFEAAEAMLTAAGDERNALYAKLGKIRSTIERRSLPAVSAELESELDSNPLLQSDDQLRMFCLIVKGDIDGEYNSGAMRADWEQVQTLAEKSGDRKWQYRSLAQLGIAAFYDGDLPTATKNVSSALVAATANGDAGAQIRFLTAIGLGFIQAKMYDQALPYFERALKVADATPEAGYQYLTYESKLEALIALGQLRAARRLADDVLLQAREQHRPWHEAMVLILVARIALVDNDRTGALSGLERSLTLTEATGLRRQLAVVQSLMANIYREKGDLANAEHFAELAAASTQASGDAWAVPQRLQTLAELKISRGEYAEADRVFDRAGAFIDGMIGNYAGVFEKTALIRASSELYTKHFALIAEKFRDPRRAYAIVEQVRGRIMTDLLLSGSVTSAAATENGRTLSRLRLRLLEAHSTEEARRIRDEIFVAEQARWTAPDVSILKSRSHDQIGISEIQRTLTRSAVLLEYVVAAPRSYCLVISGTETRIVPLEGKERIDALALAYLRAVKAKRLARDEASRLYEVLLQPISEARAKRTLVVVRDGRLHLLPFDALMDATGHYVAEAHTVAYAPSASSFYLLALQQRSPSPPRRTLLAVGGVPYGPDQQKQVRLTRGYDATNLSDLPASKDEVLAAERALRGPTNKLLLGSAATESAFKRSALGSYGLIHLAVHGLANTTDPDLSALFLLSDSAALEDGILHASEIVRLKVKAAAVILSACETAVGRVEGEEGIATLSRAFLLAGAKAVVSTLWSVDDTSSLFLMRKFYEHVASRQSPADALATAKRDMLKQYGAQAVPYYWAGFTFEGKVD